MIVDNRVVRRLARGRSAGAIRRELAISASAVRNDVPGNLVGLGASFRLEHDGSLGPGKLG